MSRNRRLLILTLVLAIAIPVGLDSMGKVFAGAVGFSSNPGTNGIHDGSGSHGGPWGALQAAWRGKSHQPAPPQSDVVNSDSQGKRFDEAANQPNGHADAPWIDSSFPKELWHSDDFNSFEPPQGSSGPGGPGNGGGPNSQGGAPYSGGEILGGGPGGPGGPGGKSDTTSSTLPTESSPVGGDAPVAPTPEPATVVLFLIGIAGTAKTCRKRLQSGFTPGN